MRSRDTALAQVKLASVIGSIAGGRPAQRGFRERTEGNLQLGRPRGDRQAEDKLLSLTELIERRVG